MQTTKAITSWNVKAPEPGLSGPLARDLGVSPLAAQLLINRGICSPDQARDFLSPKLTHAPTFHGMRGMDRAVEVLLRAIAAKQTIGIAGDYDADGVTSSTLMVDFFRQIGSRVVCALPHRINDGYGFTPQMAERLKQAGAQVVITVDCGVSDHPGVELANSLGLTVVITDHHQVPPGPLPPAAAVVNPQRPDCAFGHDLAGVGVAFYLAAALRAALRENGFFSSRPEPNLRQSLDLVAIGSVADVAPMAGLNRLLTSEGLKVMAERRRPGLAALMDVAGVRGQPDGRDLGFNLAPRINAPGRLGDPTPALSLLLAPDHKTALPLARKLDQANSQRREVEAQMLSLAWRTLERDPDSADSPFPVLSGQGWHKGVLGLVAGQLSRQLSRPVMVFGIENGHATGSGRSIAGFHIHRALNKAADLLDRFGGHAMAAGASLPTKNLPALAEVLAARAKKELGEGPPRRRLDLEAMASFGELDSRLGQFLDRLAPFGPGNPEPMLAVKGITVDQAREVGQGHLKMVLTKDSHQLPAIGFGLAENGPPAGAKVDLAFTPQMSNFGGRHLELVVADVRPSRD